MAIPGAGGGYNITGPINHISSEIIGESLGIALVGGRLETETVGITRLRIDHHCLRRCFNNVHFGFAIADHAALGPDGLIGKHNLIFAR